MLFRSVSQSRYARLPSLVGVVVAIVFWFWFVVGVGLGPAWACVGRSLSARAVVIGVLAFVVI